MTRHWHVLWTQKVSDYDCSSMLLAKQLWLKWAAAVLALCDHSPPTFSIIASRWRGMLWAVTATQTTQPLSVRTLLHSIWKSYLAFSLIPFNMVLGANVTYYKRTYAWQCQKVEFACWMWYDDFRLWSVLKASTCPLTSVSKLHVTSFTSRSAALREQSNRVI